MRTKCRSLSTGRMRNSAQSLPEAMPTQTLSTALPQGMGAAAAAPEPSIHQWAHQSSLPAGRVISSPPQSPQRAGATTPQVEAEGAHTSSTTTVGAFSPARRACHCHGPAARAARPARQRRAPSSGCRGPVGTSQGTPLCLLSAQADHRAGHGARSPRRSGITQWPSQDGSCTLPLAVLEPEL